MLRLSQGTQDQELQADLHWQNITARNGQESFLPTEEIILKLKMRFLSIVLILQKKFILMKIISDDHSQ